MKKYVDNHNEFIRKLIRKELNLLYENDNKYIDDILDRMNKYPNATGGIFNKDKEYLRRLKTGEDISDLEQDYDEFDKLKKHIFRDIKINPNWDFIILKQISYEEPLYFDKETFQIYQLGKLAFKDIKEFGIYLDNPKEIEDDVYYHEDFNDLLRGIFFTPTNDEGYNMEYVIAELKRLQKKRHVFDFRVEQNTIFIKFISGELQIEFNYENQI